jgi:thiamine biosynthesis lipoprotein
LSCPDAADLQPAPPELVVHGRAMATRIQIRIPLTGEGAGPKANLLQAANRALEIFQGVDRACTRFDPDSPLMQANRSPENWHALPEPLFLAVQEAKRAHDETKGLFDPRVLRRLVAIGYDRTLPFHAGRVVTHSGGFPPARRPLPPWRPRFRGGREAIMGDEPLDLGGIGKGLAVRWASRVLADETDDYLVEAGGDCYCAGGAPGGGPWLIGVEDPARPASSLSVLSVRDRGVATSSGRLRRWIADRRRVHHLIDPRTGLPGGGGLLSVTVVGADPAQAEAWSKALFIAGLSEIAPLAGKKALAVLWVDESGAFSMTPAMEKHVRWQRT